MPLIERITLFKIPKEEDREQCLEQYRILGKTALKDSKPYILQLTAGIPIVDQRSKGFNVAIKSTFASLGDMEYYDKHCPAHASLKAIVGPTREDGLTVCYESALLKRS